MNNNFGLIYEGKAKKIFAHNDTDKVIIEFKDDATAFNAQKNNFCRQRQIELSIVRKF